MAYKNQFNYEPRRSVLDTPEMRAWSEEQARPKGRVMRAIHWIGEEGWRAELRALFVMVVGIWLIFHFWPISEYSHMGPYWWLIAFGIGALANLAAFVGWPGKWGKVDIPGMFMSPAGKYVWDNYADLNVIAGMVKKRMESD